jgi:hypothetical protein
MYCTVLYFTVTSFSLCCTPVSVLVAVWLQLCSIEQIIHHHPQSQAGPNQHSKAFTITHYQTLKPPHPLRTKPTSSKSPSGAPDQNPSPACTNRHHLAPCTPPFKASIITETALVYPGHTCIYISHLIRKKPGPHQIKFSCPCSSDIAP